MVPTLGSQFEKIPIPYAMDQQGYTVYDAWLGLMHQIWCREQHVYEMLWLYSITLGGS